MDIQENVSLKAYSTMRLGGNSRWLAEAHDKEDIAKLVEWAKNKGVDFIAIGSGSNIVWKDEGYQGLVIVNKIPGKQILADDESGAVVRINSGEVWDEAVEWTVKNGLSGIEFMSLIPGSAGAGPIQNIGAYGAELSEVLKEVEVYDTSDMTFKSLLGSDCGFAYRNSRFKSQDKGRFIVTGMILNLKKQPATGPFYESLQRYFDVHNITDFSPKSIRQAVIDVRNSKLPNPSKVANNGSFFTNPFVSSEQFERLKQKYPEIKGWPAKNGRIKLAAGWLLETAGFKDYHDQETGMATWPQQALVMVNENAKSTNDLLKFKQKIVDKVQEMFGVTLEQEPELLP